MVNAFVSACKLLAQILSLYAACCQVCLFAFFCDIRDATHEVNAVNSTVKYVVRDTVSLQTAVFR